MLKKDKEYYSAYGWEESDDSPYLWNDVDGKWYKQEAGSKEKIYFYGDLKSHIRTKPLKSYYIKEKGGDPRNHSWKEVGESEYEKAKKSEFFKKIETETRS